MVCSQFFDELSGSFDEFVVDGYAFVVCSRHVFTPLRLYFCGMRMAKDLRFIALTA